MLSIVMPTFRDYAGVWMTVVDIHRERLRLNLLNDIEIVVCDNEPDGPHGKHVKTLLAGFPNAKYVAFDAAKGTAPAKNAAIKAASGEFFCCIDSHVMLGAGVLERLYRFWHDGTGGDDLYQGPTLHGSINSGDGKPAIIGTHFSGVWGEDGMFGKWGVATDALDPESAPFDILMMGCGLFTAKTSTWLGFHPDSRGFGGEEGYIHEKYRQHGRKTWCLPWLHWIHRFGHIDGVHHDMNWADRCRNYLLSFKELRFPDFAGILKAHVASGRVTERAFRLQCTELGINFDAERRPVLAAPPAETLKAYELRTAKDLPCVFRARESGSILCNKGCQSQQGDLVTLWDCRKHGHCTVTARRSDMRSCPSCADRKEA